MKNMHWIGTQSQTVQSHTKRTDPKCFGIWYNDRAKEMMPEGHSS